MTFSISDKTYMIIRYILSKHFERPLLRCRGLRRRQTSIYEIFVRVRSESRDMIEKGQQAHPLPTPGIFTPLFRVKYGTDMST